MYFLKEKKSGTVEGKMKMKNSSLPAYPVLSVNKKHTLNFNYCSSPNHRCIF